MSKFVKKFKKLNKFLANILNSKITHLALILIILIQFVLVSIIFLQNKTSKDLIEQANFQSASIETQQSQLIKKINSLQTHIMRMSTQIYRLQQTDNR